MARGWESKSVEAQQSEAAQETDRSRARLSREQAATVREKGNLELSRKRVLQQLEKCTNSHLRQTLEQALAELDRKLSDVH